MSGKSILTADSAQRLAAGFRSRLLRRCLYELLRHRRDRIVLWFICTQIELEEDGPVATGSTASLPRPGPGRNDNRLRREQRAASAIASGWRWKIRPHSSSISAMGLIADRLWRVPLYQVSVPSRRRLQPAARGMGAPIASAKAGLAMLTRSIELETREGDPNLPASRRAPRHRHAEGTIERSGP